MTRLTVFTIIALIIAVNTPAIHAAQINILVEQDLQSKISSALQRYSADLKNEGYNAKIVSVASNANPDGIRSQLKQDYDKNNLKGVVIIGAVPPVWFSWSDGSVAVDWYKSRGQGDGKDVFPTYFYYANLIGTWGGKDKYGNYTAISGSRKPDVFLGIIRADKLSGDSEENYINSYFERNHAWRTGTWSEKPAERGLGGFMVGGYTSRYNHWRGLGQILTRDNVDLPGTPSNSDYLKKLGESDGWLTNYFVAAMYWDRTQGFYAKVNGRLYLNQILAAKPKIYFFSLIGCCTSGNFDAPDYWSGSLVFKTSHGLATLAGASNDGGTMRDNDCWTRYFAYTRMGLRLGDAYIKAMKEFDVSKLTQGGGSPLNNHIIGDPTLRINPDRGMGNEIAMKCPVQTSSGSAGSLVDGAQKSVWASDSKQQQTITVDLKSCRKVKSLLVVWDINDIGENFSVKTSALSDGPWKTAETVSGNKAVASSVILNQALDARFIRLELTKAKNSSYGIQDLTIFEQGSGTQVVHNAAKASGAFKPYSINISKTNSLPLTENISVDLLGRRVNPVYSANGVTIIRAVIPHLEENHIATQLR